MVVEFDPEKSRRNAEERGLPFELVERMDWGSALILIDDRQDYGEARYQVLGMIDDRLHVAVFTPRASDLRVISLRKANAKERSIYGKELARGPGRAP